MIEAYCGFHSVFCVSLMTGTFFNDGSDTNDQIKTELLESQIRFSSSYSVLFASNFSAKRVGPTVQFL